MKHKYIETPEKMYELFEGYKASLKPREIQKATAAGVKSEWHTPPLTMEGFEVYGYSQGVTLEHYFRNETGSYDAYCTICSHIKKEIRRDQIEGGMVGQFNPSITQRLNSLTEKTENTNTHEIKEIKINIKRNATD